MKNTNKVVSIDLFNVIYSSHLSILGANISMSRWGMPILPATERHGFIAVLTSFMIDFVL